jgi:16S rRNA (uracil1498-N3)-methyltransferase
MEWFLEKATEIGVDEITPLLCSHSERKQVNAERMLKILVSATKQSKNMFLPRLNPLCPFEEFVMKAQAEGKFIAHCVDTDKKSLLNNCPKNKNVIVLIGPEGDFSDVEIALALSKGFTPVTLGDSRLRTETAGVVACHIANLVQQL